jgi:hypothetical protein
MVKNGERRTIQIDRPENHAEKAKTEKFCSYKLFIAA